MTFVDGAYWIVLIDYSIFKMLGTFNNSISLLHLINRWPRVYHTLINFWKRNEDWPSCPSHYANESSLYINICNYRRANLPRDVRNMQMLQKSESKFKFETLIEIRKTST